MDRSTWQVNRPEARPVGRKARSLCLSITLLALAVLVGCGGTVIDAKKAREAVRDDVERKTGVSVGSVSCPSDVEVSPGDTFTCRVVAGDGRVAEVELRIRNYEADLETLSIRLVRS